MSLFLVLQFALPFIQDGSVQQMCPDFGKCLKSMVNGTAHVYALCVAKLQRSSDTSSI